VLQQNLQTAISAGDFGRRSLIAVAHVFSLFGPYAWAALHETILR